MLFRTVLLLHTLHASEQPLISADNVHIIFGMCILDKPIAVAPSVEPTEVPPVKAASSQRTEHRVSVICFETGDVRVHCMCMLLQVAFIRRQTKTIIQNVLSKR